MKSVDFVIRVLRGMRTNWVLSRGIVGLDVGFGLFLFLREGVSGSGSELGSSDPPASTFPVVGAAGVPHCPRLGCAVWKDLS